MIRIFEVGPRDGLQNEPRMLDLDQKLDLIEALLKAGLDNIEVGAFVRPDRVPQMAGSDSLFRSDRFQALQKQFAQTKFWALVPNERGLARALECGAKNIAVFTGATETFVKKNIGMTIAESLSVFSDVIQKARQERLGIRGYISVCWVCPYEGRVSPDAVLRVVKSMLDMGIQEISLGDTVGHAHPDKTEALLNVLLKTAPAENFAVHFHDTFGMALANIDRSMQLGITVADSSIGGLGGCPYAPGASGNVATEDVYTLLEGYAASGKVVHRLDVSQLLRASLLAQNTIGHSLLSKRLKAQPPQ